MLIGAVLVLTGAVETFARRTRAPSVTIYLLLGMLLAAADERFGILGPSGREAFSVFADIGVIALLFRVGLESNPAGLLSELKPALLVWVGDITVSGTLGFLAARYWAGLAVEPSLFIGAALTATSIGVTVSAWRDAKALDSANGRLLLDVAELDDISGVVLMAMLMALLPALAGEGMDTASVLMRTGGTFVLTFGAFAALCLLFARYAEAPLTRLTARLEPAPHRMLTVAGIGLIIAALAAALGFSFAIGALFAGLMFSRDPAAIRTEARFTDLHAFFVPFFFIGIGLAVDPGALGYGLALAAALLVAAFAGKMLGAFIPSIWFAGATGALTLGVSLIPRAEIALIIAYQGRALDVLPQGAYAALVLVCAATCLVAPWALAGLLHRFPQHQAAGVPS
jgi:Kef-type K+ transport system membrane component KefB